MSLQVERAAVKIITSREFNQDVSQAKRAARIEPVFVTDRGRPTHVLMSVETYRRLTGQTETIVDLLAMPGLPAVELPRSEAWDRQGRQLGND
uniref:type II toxin-antitoxin system Phd/YefM family antitoxin n=1 Tax=uncultured Caulobacter sp. TaxID=158749 RepID=UPI00345B616F